MTATLEREDPKAQQPKRRSRWRLMVFVTLLVTVGLVAAGVLPLQQYLERENQVHAAQDELDRLLEQNAQLSDDAQALLSDQEIERMAREQYGFVRPGEIGYIVVTPDGDEQIATAQAPPDPVEEGVDRSLLQRIWDFITGNDVSADE